ncbi:methylated-DNA--[protein]-cysteine S-methyltransferase [Polaribacter sp.]|uniref:methylated-DNA--[protein]-cysteine S-methyltransferase n=1 Tax=Polaribacter sp. TaxID=1920175 RepID=UPI003F696E39
MITSEITYYKTPIGIAKIIGTENGIESVTIVDEKVVSEKELAIKTPKLLQNCVTQLEEYFNRERASFDLTVNPKGTYFQKKVWKSLLTIPYGKTRSYLAQSKALGDAKAIRAVAAANGKNPLWIIIPCHRIIGSNGSLTGYAGGIWRKKWLLNHENPSQQQTLF